MGCQQSTRKATIIVAIDTPAEERVTMEEIVDKYEDTKAPNRAAMTTEFVKNIVSYAADESLPLGESVLHSTATLKNSGSTSIPNAPVASIVLEGRKSPIARPPTPREFHQTKSSARLSFIQSQSSTGSMNHLLPSKKSNSFKYSLDNKSQKEIRNDDAEDFGQNENVHSTGSSDSDDDAADATNWLDSGITPPRNTVQAINDTNYDCDSDDGDNEVQDWLSTSKNKAVAAIGSEAPISVTTEQPKTSIAPGKRNIPTNATKQMNPVRGAATMDSPFREKPMLVIRQLSGGISSIHNPATPTQPANIRDTTVVKKKKAQLPTHNLLHPRPISGDWLNSRTMINNYIILESLGAGSYAEVKLCKEKTTGQLFAMKFIDRDVMNKHGKLNKQPDNLMDIKREIAIMKKLNHPNVLRLYEVMDDPHMNKLFLVLEYMQLGDLLSFKKAQKKHPGVTTISDTVCEPMSDRELHGVALQVLFGLAYLHEQNIVHGDLKPQNLLIGERGVVKIADFGISQNLYGSKQKLLEALGTPAFMSPEMCSGVQYSGQLADVWAVGATLYMLKFGNPPFVAKSALQVFKKIQNDPLVFPHPIDPALGDFLVGVLTKDPGKRLALQEAMLHPWITKDRQPLDRRMRPTPPNPFSTSTPITVSADEINSAIHESPTSNLPSNSMQVPMSPQAPPLSHRMWKPLSPSGPPPVGYPKGEILSPIHTPTRSHELTRLHEQGSSRRRIHTASKRKHTLSSEETNYRSELFAQKKSHPKLSASSNDDDIFNGEEFEDSIGEDDNFEPDDAEAIYQSANGLDELLLATLAPTTHEVLPSITSDASTFTETSQSLVEHANNPSLGICMGAASIQGRRSTQEDRWVAIPNVQTYVEDHLDKEDINSRSSRLAYVGLYDGHGGDTCVSLLHERLHVEIFRRLNFPLPDNLTPTIQESCLRLDSVICDELYSRDCLSGSTATFCLIDGTCPHGTTRLILGHVGDCRALLCRRGKSHSLTIDHRCSTKAEVENVIASGGTVINYRVNGVLAITRTFGDLEFKGREVKAVQKAAKVYSQETVGTVLQALPDVILIDVQSSDEFLLIACDGVWEVMSSESAIDFVSKRLAIHHNVHFAAEELAQEAIRCLSSDNVTVILVQLNVSKDAVKQTR